MSRHCRFCHTPLTHTFADLGLSPLSNSYVKAERLNQGEVFYPLHAWVCPNCQLVQLEEFEQAENIFNDEYAYFSSYSSSWLAHAKHYSEAMTARFGLNARSQVVEIASNDGYLLQNFVAAGIPALGVEPTGNTADVAISKGIPTWVKFFGVATAGELVAAGHAADLLDPIKGQVQPPGDGLMGPEQRHQWPSWCIAGIPTSAIAAPGSPDRHGW